MCFFLSPFSSFLTAPFVALLPLFLGIEFYVSLLFLAGKEEIAVGGTGLGLAIAASLVRSVQVRPSSHTLLAMSLVLHLSLSCLISLSHSLSRSLAFLHSRSHLCSPTLPFSLAPSLSTMQGEIKVEPAGNTGNKFSFVIPLSNRGTVHLVRLFFSPLSDLCSLIFALYSLRCCLLCSLRCHTPLY